MIVNVLLAVPQVVRNAIHTRLQSGTLTPEQAEFITSSVNGLGFRATTQGGVTYHLFDAQSDQPRKLQRFIGVLPGVRVLGAWDYETGIPIGMQRNEAGELTGTPTYPLMHAALTAMRPKKRTIDANGNVTETDQTEPGDDLLWLGQASRMYL